MPGSILPERGTVAAVRLPQYASRAHADWNFGICRASYAAMLAVLVAVLSAPAAAQDAPCRGYPESVRLLVTRGVEALRLVEREAADRIVRTRYPPI